MGPPTTRELWGTQNRHGEDRARLFTAVADSVPAGQVLYPGSYVDVAPSFVWDDVTYVDLDRRAARFFADTEEVAAIVEEHGGSAKAEIAFVHQDYTEPLALPEEGFDLLVSLYAGLISDHCTQHLRVGGTLLVNPSHGDVAMASIDPRYRLSGVVLSRYGEYRVRTGDLDGFLVPKKAIDLTPDLIRGRGKGIAYTQPAFAYLFERVS